MILGDICVEESAKPWIDFARLSETRTDPPD
jgi:hypothetical protein